MRLQTLLHKGWVWLLLSVFVLLLLVALLTSTLFTPWLKQKLEADVQKQTNGLYTLQLHGFDSSLLRGRLVADSLTLSPDFAAWQAIHEQQDTAQLAPPMLLSIKSDKIILSGLNYLGIARGKSLDLGSVRLQRPQLVVTQMRRDTTESEQPLYATLEGIAKGLHIRKILVEEGAVQLNQSPEDTTGALNLKNLTLRLDDLRLDSSSFHEQERAYYSKSIAVESGKIRMLLPDKTYRVEVGALKANTTDGTLNIGNLKFIPLVKHAALARLKGMAVTTLNIEVPEINASGIKYPLHSREKNLVADLIVVEQPSLSAYMDRKNFLQKGDKPLPHDLLKQLNTGLTLHKVEVKRMYVQYEELAPEASETGKITIDNLYATATNITNDKNRMSAKNPAVIDAKASINGIAPLTATVRMNLLDPNGFHTVQGTISKSNPSTLNSIVEATAFVSIKEGTLQQGEFNMQLTRTRASGSLNLRYNDFKVDLLTKDEDKRQSFGKKILSKVANKAVLKSDNPDNGGEMRVGEIKVVRARSKSFLAYWKDCLVSGFLSTAGVAGMGANLEDPNR